MIFLFIFSDFSNSTYSPQSCGYDESSGEDKICCGDLNGERVITPHYPKFPQQNWKEITDGTLVFLAEARPCMDHTKYCTDWIQKYPESCSPGMAIPVVEFSRKGYKIRNVSG